MEVRVDDYSVPADLKPGDIIGFSGYGWISVGINLVTYGIPFWSLSHLGIVGEHNGKLLLYESTTLCDIPCAITGKTVRGVQAQELDSRLARYRGKIYHYPLYRELYENERRRLTEFLNSQLGRPYDDVGAFRAGGLGYSWLESKLRGESLSALFCSELCAAAHSRVGVFPTDNASRWNPNRFVRAERNREILYKPRRMK